MDREAWRAVIHGVAKSQTRLSDFTFTFHFHALEKEMATHSSVLAWRIPGTGQPGGLPPMGSHRVGHDWSHLAAAAANLRRTICFEAVSYLVHFLTIASPPHHQWLSYVVAMEKKSLDHTWPVGTLYVYFQRKLKKYFQEYKLLPKTKGTFEFTYISKCFWI